MGDYDLQIIVAVVFAGALFSGFMFYYAQEPTVDYTPDLNQSANWSQTQTGVDIYNVFSLLDSMNDTEIWIVRLFVSAMGVIGVIIIARFLRGQ
jgi:hypothetical protein